MKKSKTPLKFSKPTQSTNHLFLHLPTSLSTQLNLDTDKWLPFFLKETLSTCTEISLLKNKNSSETFFYLNTSSKLTFSSKRVSPPLSVFFFQLLKSRIGLSSKLFSMKPSDQLLNLLPPSSCWTVYFIISNHQKNSTFIFSTHLKCKSLLMKPSSV